MSTLLRLMVAAIFLIFVFFAVWPSRVSGQGPATGYSVPRVTEFEYAIAKNTVYITGTRRYMNGEAVPETKLSGGALRELRSLLIVMKKKFEESGFVVAEAPCRCFYLHVDIFTDGTVRTKLFGPEGKLLDEQKHNIAGTMPS